MRYLVTGVAGFIGFHVARRLLRMGHVVTGLDCINDYYDPQIKHDRLALLEPFDQFTFYRRDLAENGCLQDLVVEGRPDRVIHLAAQAGVRYSIEEPHAYVRANVVGFLNVLEACREAGTPHLAYASSSSVYGANSNVPYSAARDAGHPLSMYAATKRSNELMAHVYSSLHGLPTTGMRFFTVYGPWGRPDMALFRFTRAILAGETIDVYNHGEHHRDFTHIDDVVDAVVAVTGRVATPDGDWDSDDPRPDRSSAPYRVYNIGRASPVALLECIEALETALGRQSVRRYLPRQPGDVMETWADCSELGEDFDWKPTRSLASGIGEFVEWYRDYYG